MGTCNHGACAAQSVMSAGVLETPSFICNCEAEWLSDNGLTGDQSMSVVQMAYLAKIEKSTNRKPVITQYSSSVR